MSVVGLIRRASKAVVDRSDFAAFVYTDNRHVRYSPALAVRNHG
jgi:hypothetical protein